MDLGGSKKNKKDLEPSNNAIYSHSNLSGNGLRRTQSPTKFSPSKLSSKGAQGSAAYTSSPTKRSRTGQSLQHQDLQLLLQYQQQLGSVLPLKRSSIQTTKSTTVNADPPLFLCEPYVKTALVKGSFKTIVQLRNMWIIVNGWR